MGLPSSDSLSALDEYIAPGLRLWMLIGLVSAVLLVMVVIVCCFMRIRIPRTKRQIEIIAAKRKMRAQLGHSNTKGNGGGGATELTGNGGNGTQNPQERQQAIVLNSMPTKQIRNATTASSSTSRQQPASSSSRQHTAV